jgi:hypothetical protein
VPACYCCPFADCSAALIHSTLLLIGHALHLVNSSVNNRVVRCASTVHSFGITKCVADAAQQDDLYAAVLLDAEGATISMLMSPVGASYQQLGSAWLLGLFIKVEELHIRRWAS